jgi:putative RecB family exonuclease
MPVYSHSKLSTYEDCPLKYKLCYIDHIKRDTKGIEAFLGSRVHDTLKKCYDDLEYSKPNSLGDLLAFYNKIWQENWHDSIVIVRKEMTQEQYRKKGEKLIERYYNRHAPFDADHTIGTEVALNFSLDDAGKYRMTGYIDRFSVGGDFTYYIHDYKTSAYLPSQHDIDNDRQLALYQIGIQKRWPDMKKVRLVWHYLAFDTDLVSFRAPPSISNLKQHMKSLIDEIESAEDFPPRESRLCDWCEYPDLCPMRKHFYVVEALPTNEYLKEPGVVLVNKYAELREKVSELNEEVEKVKEALVEYARKEGVELIKGSDIKARVKFDERLKFPGKSDKERQELDSVIMEAGKWMEVSQLDTTALTQVIKESGWDKPLLDQVMKYGRTEETTSVYLSKLVDREE